MSDWVLKLNLVRLKMPSHQLERLKTQSVRSVDVELACLVMHFQLLSLVKIKTLHSSLMAWM